MATFKNLSSKTITLWQRPCKICNPQGIIQLFSIRVSPKSCRNNDSKIKKAFSNSIKDKLGKDHLSIWNGKRLCVSLTFVIKNGNTEKDIDNMSKILMDAFHDIFYKNDRYIDHLDSVKIRSEDDEEFILFRIMETDINDHIDVENKNFKHGWAGQEVIDLSNYLDK